MNIPYKKTLVRRRWRGREVQFSLSVSDDRRALDGERDEAEAAFFTRPAVRHHTPLPTLSRAISRHVDCWLDAQQLLER